MLIPLTTARLLLIPRQGLIMMQAQKYKLIQQQVCSNDDFDKKYYVLYKGIPKSPTGSFALTTSQVTLTLSSEAAGTDSGNTTFTFRATFTPSAVNGTEVTKTNTMSNYTSGSTVVWVIAMEPGTYTASVIAINEFGSSSALSLGSLTVPKPGN